MVQAGEAPSSLETREHDTKDAIAGSLASTCGYRQTIFTISSDKKKCGHLEDVAKRERSQLATMRVVPRSHMTPGFFHKGLANYGEGATKRK